MPHTEALVPFEAAVLARAYDFSGIDTMVDLGGAESSLAVAIMQANPAMRGVFMEEPHRAEAARKCLLAGGVLNRCDLIAAGFHEALLANADACLLSAFHRLSDDDAVAMMRRCRSAMPAHGRLLIIERFLADGTFRTDPEHASTLPAGAAAGRLRTLERAQELLREGGFHATCFVPMGAALGLLEARPGDLP